MGYKHEETHKQILLSYHAYLGDDSGEKEISEVYAKAHAYDQIKVIHDKHIYDFLNMSETECIEKIGDILERE